MARDSGNSDLSELEREFELEMEDAMGASNELDEEIEDELDQEADDSESELESAFELEAAGSDYGERLHELASREFESETEVDSALNEVLNEIEQEFFFGKLRRGWKKFKNSAIGGLVTKVVSKAAGHLPAFQALKGVTALARGDLSGMAKSLVKAGLGSVVPGGGAALSAMQSLGFGGDSELAEGDREAWNNVAEVAREAYEHLADNLTANVDQPLEASRLASNAFRAGLTKVSQRAARGGGAPPRSGAAGRRKRRIRLRRGDILVIECE